MPRDYKVYLDDILEAIAKIQEYTKRLTLKKFLKDDKTLDAVVRNLEIIGEASKNIPQGIRSKKSTVEWNKIIGLRNMLIHEYFGIDTEIIWDIVQNKLPDLKNQVQKILNNK